MPFRLSLKEHPMFSQIDTPNTILSNLANAILNIINKASMLFAPSETYQVPQCIEKGQNLQRQMLDILVPIQEDYRSRLSLRLALGLSPVFKEDPDAIRSLEGAISNITKEKVNVTEFIRNIRDNP